MANREYSGKASTVASSSMRFPLLGESREVAEARLAAAEADVPEEMIVKLHEVTSGAACLDHLPPVAEESDDAAKSSE
jgi:hypothetical protein